MEDPTATSRPVRTFVGLFALLAGLLFGGMATGLAIAVVVAGGSVGAIVAGFLFLPLVLGLGMSAWRGIVVAWLVGGLGRALWRSRGDEAGFRAATRDHVRSAGGNLPGTWVFVPIAVLVSLVAAVLMAVSADRDGMTAGALTFGIGVAYGVLLRRLARSGLLPLPED